MKLLKLQLISLLCIHPDFQAWFHGHDSTCHDSTLITLRMASQYVNGCKNNGRREFCRGNRNGERNTGWQGKLITKRHNCNEARIPTNAFCLKRKALLRGKRRHDERLLVINLEFDCRVRMYFIMDEILSIRRKAKWSDVLSFSLLPHDKVAVFTHAICM